MFSEEKYVKYRNMLIEDAVQEMGEAKARKFFGEKSNRDAVEDIARYKATIMPDRNIDVEQFRGRKWKHDK